MFDDATTAPADEPGEAEEDATKTDAPGRTAADLSQPHQSARQGCRVAVSVSQSCSWCGHPKHEQVCDRRINVAAAPSGGEELPTKDVPCKCKINKPPKASDYRVSRSMM